MSDHEAATPRHPGPLSHDDVRAVMPEYIAEIIDGRDPQKLYPAVAEHLERCEECRGTADETLQIALFMYSGDVLEVSQPPGFDLAFLKRSQLEASSFWDQLSRLVVQFSAGLLDKIRFAAPRISADLMVARKDTFDDRLHDAHGELRYHYEDRVTHRQTAEMIQLVIDVFSDVNAPDMSNVHVAVDRAMHDALTQEGVSVLIRLGSLVQQAVTDESGAVVFNGIPSEQLSTLRIEIMMPQE